MIQVRLQTVSVHNVDIDKKSKVTVGQYVDNLIADSLVDKRVPNKIVIDLNPKVDNPAEVEPEL